MTRESAPAPALIAVAFIERAEALDAPMRLIPKAPTAARMIRIVLPRSVKAFT